MTATAAMRDRADGDESPVPSPSPVAGSVAGGSGDARLARRASRLGLALAGLAQELAAARREIVALKRENTQLISRLTAQDAGLRSEAP